MSRPAEPADGGVVRDDFGDLWVRVDAFWHEQVDDGHVLTWQQLCDMPLLLHPVPTIDSTDRTST